MKSYLVLIRDLVTNECTSTICKNNDEVATLISHLNTDQFSVERIEAISNFVSSISEFCVKNNNLETGEKGDS